MIETVGGKREAEGVGKEVSLEDAERYLGWLLIVLTMWLSKHIERK